MAFRFIPKIKRKEALTKCIKSIDVSYIKQIAHEYDIDFRTLQEDCYDILDEADTMFKKKHPGAKSKKSNQDEIKDLNSNINNNSNQQNDINGNKSKINFVKSKLMANIMALMIILFKNKDIKREQNNIYYKFNDNNKKLTDEIIKYKINRLILECRFGCKISIRNIHKIINGYYSTGYIHNLCIRSAKNAEKIMSELNRYTEKECLTAILDETFPKAIEKSKVRLAVLADEYGLIRGIDVIPNKNRHKRIVKFLKSCVSANYRPKYFLSDYDKVFPGAVKEAFENIMIYKDFVHSIRQILKYIKSTMRGVHTVVNSSAKLTKQKQKDINNLKKRLLKKQLNVVMKYLYKGFSCKNTPVGTLYLEGFLNELEILSNKFNSLLPIYEKSKKFINKYMDTWNLQMISYYYNSTLYFLKISFI